VRVFEELLLLGSDAKGLRCWARPVLGMAAVSVGGLLAVVLAVPFGWISELASH
jgi:ABC-type dipeptide/oligopeptide/nickel transport system permease subunit